MYDFKVTPNKTTTTSDFLNNLVFAYRDGLPGSAEALIEAFEPLLKKYSALLLDGDWDHIDKDIAKLLKMLSTGDLDSAADRLSMSIRRQFEPEDIRQELVLALLSTAQKYVNISSTFVYTLKERLGGLLKDRFVYDRAVPDPDLERFTNTKPITEIDESWIEGLTASDGWDKLSTTQRTIIKYLYNDGLAEAVAAKKLKMSVRQLQRYNKKAKEILADYFDIKEK